MPTKGYCGDHFCNTTGTLEEAAVFKSDETKYNSALSSGDKMCFEELKDPDAVFQTDASAESVKNNSEESSNNSSIGSNRKDEESKDIKV